MQMQHAPGQSFLLTVAHTLLVGAALLWLGCRPSVPTEPLQAAQRSASSRATAERLVTVGGGITETVFALGLGQRVVGVDTSSVFPSDAARLPKVGYQRMLSAEGVLALRPTRVLVAEEAGPPHALAQLRSAGVPVELISGSPTIAGARAKILTIAKLLEESEQGAQLVAQLDAEVARAQSIALGSGKKQRVLFLYARGAGTLLVAGNDTTPAAMIELAGAENAASAVHGFKPYSAEAIVAAQPDVLLLTDSGAASLGGAAGVQKLPGLTALLGHSAPSLIAIDDLLLLGFGPRTGQAVAELRTKLARLSTPAIVAADPGTERAQTGVQP